MLRPLCLLFLVGCQSAIPGAGDTDDGPPADTDGADTDVADTAAPTDTDGGDTDVADTDAPPFVPDPGCDYLDLDVYQVFCGRTQSLMRRWAPVDGDPSCPVFYTLGGDPWLDAGAALADAGCDDTCVYRNHQAVMLVYCGSRGEYITWLPDGPGQDGDGQTCDPLMEVHTVMGSAWVPDFDTYEASHGCPPP